MNLPDKIIPVQRLASPERLAAEGAEATCPETQSSRH